MSDAAAARTPSGDNNNNNKNSATTSTNDDWRSSVLHSYRNNEVREIAKILASIEGESTTVASKMMLSMKFEDQIFKSASSFDDYKKKIAKRLKKVQKTYAQQKAASGGDKDPSSSGGAGGAAAKSTGDSKSVDEPQREELLLKLRQTYGDMILYVIKNASLAMSDIERKLGPEKVEQFKPHITSCHEWAQELGIWNGNDDDDDDDNDDNNKKEEPTKVDNNKKDDNDDDNDDDKESDKPKPSTSKPSDTKKKEEKKEFKLPALSQLQRLEQHLEKRAKNIRDYVVKHADPELFLMETLERKDADVSANRRASKLLAVNLSKRIQYIQQQHQQQSDDASLQNQPQQQSHMSDQANTNTATPLQALQQALDKAKAAVPPPTRTDSKQLEASLRHLEKMRNASTALMNYWTIGEDRIATAPPQTLKRIYDVMTESMEFITNTMKEKKGEQGGSGAETVTLQDAWSKRLELPPPIVLSEDTTDTTTTTMSPPKRPRTNDYKPYIKARLLLNPNRKTPSNLLTAIRHKGARLVRPNSARGNVNTTHLILEFGTAFTMTIYLSPLTVNIRAMTSSSGSTNIVPSSDASNTAAPWQPLSYGLTNTSTGTSSSSSTSPRILSVWGVSSTYDSIGHVVEERLRDASTRATYLLRKCFQNHVKDKTVDFEVEILEGSALLEFLNITRETYMPGWQDYDYE
ncbi:KIX domain containing protein [Nitzschia inconspicua]|uniref:KIX domain containing protein n=1 Tax=Nitzschia inconspicua TaxID=303405 RepID=A0A9K3PNV7_9STRA|nr:KIX domain containing protein [Nitzschia inconspicua]